MDTTRALCRSVSFQIATGILGKNVRFAGRARARSRAPRRSDVVRVTRATARETRMSLIEQIEVTGLFLFLLFLDGGRRGGGTAATTAAAAAATATAAATHGGELRGAFLDELSDVLAVNGREESAQLSVVNFRGDCEVERNERTRLSATGRVMVRATRGRY